MTRDKVNWAEPIEAAHSDGRVRSVRLLQKNAGVFLGHDHWCCTADRLRLDGSPGAIAGFWASADGSIPSYSGWRIRNVSPAGAA